MVPSNPLCLTTIRIQSEMVLECAENFQMTTRFIPHQSAWIPVGSWFFFLLYRIGPLPFSMACRKRRIKSETNGCFPCKS